MPCWMSVAPSPSSLIAARNPFEPFSAAAKIWMMALVAVLAVSARSPSVSNVLPSAAACLPLMATVETTPLVRLR